MIQLIAVSVGLGISLHVYTVCREITARHELLIQSREQIDELSKRINNLSHASTSSLEGRRRYDLLSTEAGRSSALFLPEIAPELPAETAEVREVVARLNSVPQVSRRDAGSGAQLPDEAAFLPAAAQMDRALDLLHDGLGRLDEANISRLNAIKYTRMWALLWLALACLLTLFAFGYAGKLYRQLRREELTRFVMESPLSAERAALEERVQERTAALQTEAKERQRAEALNHGRNRMLEMVARNEPVVDIFKVLAETVAEFRRSAVCAIHTFNSGTLKLAASFGLNDQLMHNLQLISPDFLGAPESIAFLSKNSKMIEDLGAEHKPWSELLCANGLISVWSAPFSAPDGGALVLELTESIVMRDFTESARQMKRLKRLGVRIAIDDFGTGYSSLNYLHRLPIDVLKIDRSFIENLNDPDGTGPIVEAVVSMAHKLSLQVVAEGVETAEQLSSLDRCGCDLIQGYFFRVR